jgi:hypothetical protein
MIGRQGVQVTAELRLRAPARGSVSGTLGELVRLVPPLGEGGAGFDAVPIMSECPLEQTLRLDVEEVRLGVERTRLVQDTPRGELVDLRSPCLDASEHLPCLIAEGL